ncbi:MAG: twin-arginine translocase subunit TatB [Gammaproteobacteria bacterium]|nr:MAG: twin-arginine translocase subunit TatB [Gammaproteobacteria bacterium]
MFDFSFSEIGLIAVVALVVLGPERLPKVARTAGALVRRARASWQSVRDEIERELEAEEFKRSLAEARQTATDLQRDMHAASAEIKNSAGEIAADTTPPVPDPAGPPPADSASPPNTIHPNQIPPPADPR